MRMVQRFVEAIDEISYYTGKERRAVLSKVLNGTQLMADEWDAANPQNERDVIDFYRSSRSQIYGLAGYNYMNRSRYLLALKIVEKCRGRVMDFGAGVGDILIRAWDMGLRDLTHVDFVGYTLGFAVQRYAVRDMDVKLFSPDRVRGHFDSIICLDVLEHVSDPQATLLKLVSHLAPGGRIFLNTHFGHTEEHPMHFDRPAGWDEICFLASLGLGRSQVITARDLLINVKEEAERSISLAEIDHLLQAFPGHLDLIMLRIAVQEHVNFRSAECPISGTIN